MNNWNDRLRLVLIAALLATAGANIVNGIGWLFSPEGGADLDLRWREQQYVLRHKNPFDVYDHWRMDKNCELQPALSHLALEPDLGLPTPGYPPWSYGTGIAFMWSADPMIVRICFAVLNLLMLGIIACWNFSLGGARWEVGLMLAAACLTADSLCATFALGQLGIIVVGSLLAAYWLDQRNRPVLAGLLLGVALIKPTLSFPFLLAFVIKQRWLTLAVAGIYTALASGIVWALVGTDPITMLLQMQTAAVDWGTIHYTRGIDPIAILAQLGVPRKIALPMSSTLSLMIAFVVMWFWRHASLMVHFAIAGITARFWVSHFHYDDLIVLFVLFGLAEVLVKRYSTSATVAFCVLGLVLLLPKLFHIGSIWDHLAWRLGPECEVVVYLCQLASLAVLLVNSPRNELIK